ncbi:MAG TPA: PEP-CTERM sorting domain-containing protein [Nitrospirae bacterium]|nr:PEP-CTERM sorting domain-containing protein [Nitrospirota bacterium]
MVGLYDAGGSGSPEYAMMYSDDKIRMQTRDNTGAYAFNTQRSDTVISADSWHHLVFTYDGPGYNFYLDGTLDGSGSLSTTIRDIDSSPQFYIGARGDRQPGEFYEGIIDDIRIYDRALSGSEVQELTNLVVVPEPVSTVLFLAGGAVMGFVRLRKKK